MHILEGILSPPVLLGGGIVAASLLGAGLKKLPAESLMPAAVLSAAFFVGSLIHIPIGPGSAHLILNGLLGCILGFAAVPAIFCALLLQALLFHFGGLTTLGVNTCVMGLPALVCAFLFRRAIGRPERNGTRTPGKIPLWAIAAFTCGTLGVGLSGLLVALALALSGQEFIVPALSLLLAHIPVMLLEGIITACIAGFLRKTRPDILYQGLGISPSSGL